MTSWSDRCCHYDKGDENWQDGPFQQSGFVTKRAWEDCLLSGVVVLLFCHDHPASFFAFIL
ncbi:MAG TPA: hypothetical protein DCS30_03055 [Rhizobiales bacterium]|nr:hypothetical protein [Hyphomicrobiales bacterium]